MSSAIENFEIMVRHGALRGTFVIDEFLEAFKAMQPSLHRHCCDDRIVDIDALLYTMARLPASIHRTREILVESDHFPVMEGIEEIHTPARRRSTYQVGEEVVVIVAREGTSELLDLVSLLASYAIEAHKIVRLLQGTAVLADLRAYLAGAEDAGVHNRLLARLSFQLGVTVEGLQALATRGRGALYSRLLDLLDTPPHIVVHLHPAFSMEAAGQRARAWAGRLHSAVDALVPSDAPVHLVSSNLHSTVNLLTGFSRLKHDEIVQWGGAQPEYQACLEEAGDLHHEDFVYLAMRDWLRSRPEAVAEKQAYESEHGVHTLEDVHAVGVDAQIIDLSRLDLGHLDSRLRLDGEAIMRERAVVINIDYAFGEQAGIVVGQLFRLFGQRVRSFSIMGKAGTLVGERGGIMLPTYLLRDGSQDVYDLPFGNSLSAEDFVDLDVGHVWSGGPMLTVLGTILQNDDMLRRYKEEWGVLGLEMEGIPYIRTLHQCVKRGLLRADLRVAVGYYASDAPLVPGESLSRDLSWQGLNATYAINVAILNKALGPCGPHSAPLGEVPQGGQAPPLRTEPLRVP